MPISRTKLSQFSFLQRVVEAAVPLVQQHVDPDQRKFDR